MSLLYLIQLFLLFPYSSINYKMIQTTDRPLWTQMVNGDNYFSWYSKGLRPHVIPI